MRIGGYYTQCCILDLYRIDSEAELREIADDEERDGVYFDTLDEALEHMAPDMNDPDVAKAVHALQHPTT